MVLACCVYRVGSRRMNAVNHWSIEGARIILRVTGWDAAWIWASLRVRCRDCLQLYVECLDKMRLPQPGPHLLVNTRYLETVYLAIASLYDGNSLRFYRRKLCATKHTSMRHA